MITASPRWFRNAFLSLGVLALASCGGGQEQPPQQVQACPTCPVCDATPTPSAEESLQELLDKINIAEKEFRVSPGAFKASAAKFGIADKLGGKEVSSEDFPRFVSLFWDLDVDFRIQYLRAMMTTNRLVEMMKPSVGKFDINIAPKDPEAEDVSLLVSQAIVDWAQVQRILEDDFRRIGIENVMGVKPSDEMPHAEAMMQELLGIVAPPLPTPIPTPGPQATSASLLSLLLRDAHAQGQPVAKEKPGAPIAKEKSGAPLAKVSKAVPRVKVRTAPLLLARVISYNVGGKNFVLQSPLMAVQPEFQAIPVEQFQFKLEKQSVGPAYQGKVDAFVQGLAAKPNRDMVDWWNLSHALIELRLLNQLVDFSKVETGGPASGVSTDNVPSAAGANQPSPAAPTERLVPDATQARPSAGQAGAAPSATEARPSTATPGQSPTSPERQEAAVRPAQGPASAERPNTEVPKSTPSTEVPKTAPGSELPKAAP